ncbi:AmmeMemoRadiSam system radical SAM enzyme [compost metagenome]
MRDLEGATTYCTHCQAPLIVRDYYAILDYRLTEDGCCPDCGTPLVGYFARSAGHFGNRRIPVRLAS